MNAKVLQVILPFVALIIGLLVYPSLPGNIPVNWIQGEVLLLDKIYGLFLIPAFMFVMLVTRLVYQSNVYGG